uniref:Uncharacterized protein n=1 Tax=Brassica oleracea TaxID=3712 RepID=A0A3P6D639_BRAOL|nr:unnamed protein product [Brassica oleracea]
MAKPSTTTRWFLMIILVLSVSTVCVILVRSTLDSCSVIIGAIDTALKADLIVLNTAVARKWLDAVLKEDVGKALLHKIHEMRGRIILNKSWLSTYVRFVAGAMIDSHATAEYWRNRTQGR